MSNQDRQLTTVSNQDRQLTTLGATREETKSDRFGWIHRERDGETLNGEVVLVNDIADKFKHAFRNDAML